MKWNAKIVFKIELFKKFVMPKLSDFHMTGCAMQVQKFIMQLDIGIVLLLYLVFHLKSGDHKSKIITAQRYRYVFFHLPCTSIVHFM